MKKKTLFAFAVLAVMFVGLMPAFGAPPAKMTIRFVDQWKPEQFIISKFLLYADEISKRSNGRLEIVRAGGPEIIPAPDQLTACGRGAIDMVIGWPVYYAGVVPEGQILGLPVTRWNWDNIYHLGNAISDDLDKVYQKKSNIKLMMQLAGTGIFNFTRNKPVTSVADMKGLRLRTSGGLDAIILQALGAAPTRVASAEIYTAAERGIIDGASRPLQPVLDWKENEVWRYVTTTPTSFQVTGCVWLGLNTWNKIPADLQKYLVDSFKKLEIESVKHYKNVEESAMRELMKRGVKPVDLKPDEEAKWLSLPSKPAEEYFLKQSPEYGQMLINVIRAAVK
jgi:TRAP-type C4-dicarboxylate transport system substrate-binding protein